MCIFLSKRVKKMGVSWLRCPPQFPVVGDITQNRPSYRQVFLITNTWLQILTHCLLYPQSPPFLLSHAFLKSRRCPVIKRTLVEFRITVILNFFASPRHTLK
ncbi:hypothetical protein NQD34_014774 [Periophthalmus magnuspinnatus]|nr:hypothetical protein NQD34_014774 [Periophthalmus magnuspinnatus]